MSEIQTQQGQQLIDIAMQELGDAGRLYELAKLNGMLPSDLVLTPTSLVVPVPSDDKQFVVKKLKTTYPSTGEEQQEEHSQSGIGYWKISSTLKVS